MKAKQLELFKSDQPTLLPVITFASLTINEKINYKANECGLCAVLRSFYNYNRAPLYQPKTDQLTEKYNWHHRVNAGSEKRINAMNIMFNQLF